MSDASEEPQTDAEESQAAPPQSPPGAPRNWGWLRKLTRFTVRTTLLVVVPLVAAVVGLDMYIELGKTISTENAYVKAHKVAVSADLDARVAEVRVRTHDRVLKGDVLFTLDRRPFEIELARLDAEANVVEQEIRGYRAAYRVESSQLEMATKDLNYFNREYDRQKSLSAGVVSRVKVDESRHSVLMARQRVSAISEQMSQALSRLGGDPDMIVGAHPSYIRAVAMRDSAVLDLDRTVVRAPVAGVISRVDLQPGEYVENGRPVFSIVGDEQLWITANLKETELTHIQLGHEATVLADAYPSQLFKAQVDSIAPATGAEFSLLPPQNASGNWVKVVQRIPVRLLLEGDEVQKLLRVGMSVRVEIDTGVEPEIPEFLRAVVTLIRASQHHLPFLNTMTALSQAQ